MLNPTKHSRTTRLPCTSTERSQLRSSRCRRMEDWCLERKGELLSPQMLRTAKVNFLSCKQTYAIISVFGCINLHYLFTVFIGRNPAGGKVCVCVCVHAHTHNSTCACTYVQCVFLCLPCRDPWCSPLVLTTGTVQRTG